MTANLKLTGWFEPRVKPAQAGAYQVCHDPSEQAWANHGYQYWDGKMWGSYSFSPQEAEGDKSVPSAFHPVYWRGLAADPAGGAK